MPSPTPHITQLNLTDDQLAALNVLMSIGVSTAQGDLAEGIFALAHFRDTFSKLGSEPFNELVRLLNKAYAANPNLKCVERT